MECRLPETPDPRATRLRFPSAEKGHRRRRSPQPGARIARRRGRESAQLTPSLRRQSKERPRDPRDDRGRKHPPRRLVAAGGCRHSSGKERQGSPPTQYPGCSKSFYISFPPRGRERARAACLAGESIAGMRTMLPGFRPRSTIYETRGSLGRSLSGPLTSSLLRQPRRCCRSPRLLLRLCFCLDVL